MPGELLGSTQPSLVRLPVEIVPNFLLKVRPSGEADFPQLPVCSGAPVFTVLRTPVPVPIAPSTVSSDRWHRGLLEGSESMPAVQHLAGGHNWHTVDTPG
ncbi:hypothetical protein Y1Q_0010937 [Alligator mississippiensis]|uniref:Uncharacterized protein n=1 Tax=Alligator mississippiensis TaxID=8496 RepID=A0A151MEG4_ALLMI|nr:hypothetical protein Y1Q_0010937 [Alligator mississippiensis]